MLERSIIFLSLIFACALSAHATPIEESSSVPQMLTLGFGQIDAITPKNYTQSLISKNDKPKVLSDFCRRLMDYFKQHGWTEEPCGKVDWQTSLKTKNGFPLIYATFGAKAEAGTQTTLLLSGVHPDELTPIPVAFRFARYLSENDEVFRKKNIHVVVAPLVNPDGFLRNVPTRTNSNGIDVNRNFFTMDWYDSAFVWWEKSKQSNLKHFPGYFPNTEIETLFQIKLLDELSPDKIVSIHAPLGFLDYDGPGDGKPTNLSDYEKKAKQFAEVISEKSSNYRIVDYSFYPGSLGNFAGNERGIPTVTLELSTTDPKAVTAFWNQFLPGLIESVEYPFKNPVSDKKKISNFYDRYRQLESAGTEQL